MLCAAGAVAALYLAGPLVMLVGRYAARFSIRALDVSVDSNVAWVGAALAIAAAVLLAFVPRLLSSDTSAGLGVASGGVRITPGTKRRLQMFATIQIAGDRAASAEAAGEPPTEPGCPLRPKGITPGAGLLRGQ